MSTDPFGICLEPKCDDTEEPKLPSIFDQAKGFINSAKDVVGGALAGDGVTVDESIYNSRMSICRECPLLIKETERCSECGCFMKVKAMFKKTYCPVGKWESVTA